METLLFTTVQNKSRRDIIVPVCFRYNFSSAVVSGLFYYAATLLELRALFRGGQITLGKTTAILNITTSLLHFTTATGTNNFYTFFFQQSQNAIAPDKFTSKIILSSDIPITGARARDAFKPKALNLCVYTICTYIHTFIRHTQN